MLSNKIKYYVLILKHIGKSYHYKKKKLFNPNNKESIFIYKGNKYPYDHLPTPIKRKNKYYWLLDLDKGFIELNEPNTTIDMNLLNQFVLKSIFTNFTQAMTGNSYNIISIVLGIIIGLLGGLFIGVSFL